MSLATTTITLCANEEVGSCASFQTRVEHCHGGFLGRLWTIRGFNSERICSLRSLSTVKHVFSRILRVFQTRFKFKLNMFAPVRFATQLLWQLDTQRVAVPDRFFFWSGIIHVIVVCPSDFLPNIKIASATFPLFSARHDDEGGTSFSPPSTTKVDFRQRWPGV